MSQLPCARQEKHDDLCDAVPHSARIRSLGQVAEIRLALALILLLATNVLNFDVQVADLARERRDVPAIMLHIGLGRTDSDIEVQADVSRGTEPRRGIVRRQADGVVACLVRGEGEAALSGTTRVDNRMTTFHFL